MTDTVDPQMPTPAQRGRVFMIAAVRGLSITIVLTVAYFSLPLGELATLPFIAIVVGGVVILTAVILHQVRSIIRAAHPAAKAVEALALTGPLFLLLFASTYFLMSQADAGSFNPSGLTRSDTLYFTVTVFATVGFGDIVATSHSARVLVTVQMILDLILIGAVVRAFVEAVRMAKKSPATPSADA
jgi:voltage-gated potassium channel